MTNEHRGPDFEPASSADDQPTEYQGGEGWPTRGEEPTQVFAQEGWPPPPPQGSWGNPQGQAGYPPPGQPPYVPGQAGRPPKRGGAKVVILIAAGVASVFLVLGLMLANMWRTTDAAPTPTQTSVVTETLPEETATEAAPEETDESVPADEDTTWEDLEDELGELDPGDLDLGDIDLPDFVELDPALFPSPVGDFELDATMGFLIYADPSGSMAVVMSLGEADLAFWEMGLDDPVRLAGDAAVCGTGDGLPVCFVGTRDLGALALSGDGVSGDDLASIAVAIAEELG